MVARIKRIFLCFFPWVLFISASHASPHSFAEAKKIAKKLFEQHRVTLYCACTYNQHNDIDLNSCNMQTAAEFKRAHRMEWEHMMPAENFGRQFECWQEKKCTHDGKNYKGRKCCEKIDDDFNQAEAELYNLWPSVGLVNQVRSNYRYSVLPKKNSFYGCDFEVDVESRQAEPGDRAKGIVARANLFMSDKYHVQLSPSQRKLFEIWSKQYPPSVWEKEWALKVAQIEGYSNSYINQE